MLFYKSLVTFNIISLSLAVQYPVNPTSDMSTDEKIIARNKTVEQSDESGHEIEFAGEDVKEKKYLEDAMQTVLDPDTVITKNDDTVEHFKVHMDELEKENLTLEAYMNEMDELSLEVCKASQEALWSYVTDIKNDMKKNKMIHIAGEEDEIKRQYWNTIKNKYIAEVQNSNDLRLKRKLRIIKERGTNVQMPKSKQREEIDDMQRIWSRVSLCAFDDPGCKKEDSAKSMNDVISIFKTSNNYEELKYYWKVYRDATGKKVRPIFKDYVMRMNKVAESENFKDAGEMWRYNFEDEDFVKTVDRIWNDVKPLYGLIHSYVKTKLKAVYNQDLQADSNLIPAHILGNLWAQEWQAIYNLVAPYPDIPRRAINGSDIVYSRDYFEFVDKFHQSLGFESASDSFQDIRETPSTANCLPSSHDMCDGVNYKIKWCGENITDINVGLSRAARLLGHVQYFKHYRDLPPLFRDGPNPAFHDAISDIAAVQLTAPHLLKNFVDGVSQGEQAALNHLMWLALEKFPLMGYAYVLDKWRWDVFGNSSMVDWNQHWWDLRIKETMISPPVARNESDLDPASKYHVVSHVQYITYLISHVLEFQILRSLCKKASYTGPLHECSIYGAQEAGKLLSDGMSLGASEDWRIVLRTITGETELSTDGILEYFSPLKEFLLQENTKLKSDEDMDASAPIIVGIIVMILIVLMFIMYCFKKRNHLDKFCAMCGLRKNGSLDIATHDISHAKTNEVEGIKEDKV
ncbi:angiotensin-converting enzyme-like isoform X1 [Leptidea sinapis]|uniref:angiotensin-converting enzyme-like isoform X1 n=2 Tax=Leptidea sinapis TaxID=189913 RepID=UPI002124D9A6|nr:angiotensin-converting enzyme-like isoform X1 [Leptidea sinapis]